MKKSKAKKVITGVGITVGILAIALFLVAKNFVAVAGTVTITKYKLSGYTKPELLLAGSSTMWKWSSAEEDLKGYDIENVGVPGSVISDWDKWLDTLITPFEPEGILLYVGANDIHIDGGSGEQAADDFEALCGKIHTALPNTHIYAVSVYTIGSHPEYMPEDILFNERLEAFAEKNTYMSYIDVWTPLLDEDGKVRNEVYAKDLLHLSDEGYVVWTKAIREVLDQ
ncbi:MAG: GDSL-type esterase/lipase family protein [Clostridiales Family XIII bacterium]|jgi:lysophospholipase L1-like esterase|nr:GDSL-type esterase/lipase family protein [Clostridiales Family XIII bacterium]